MPRKSFKRAFNIADEYYTPSCLVEILIPYIRKWEKDFMDNNGRKPIVWCPFDREESKYVQLLKSNGFNVIYSHIDDGKDFFNYEPKEWDIVISNPPFSRKLDVMERLHSFGKPFVLLLNMMCINYQEIGESMFRMGTDIQFLIPDKKVSFNGKTSSFCSGYVCYRFAERTEFVHLDNNNVGKYFRR